MAERLTEYVTKNCREPFYRFNENSHISVRYRYCANIDKAINKLGKLEDILEKYGIESVEELDEKLANFDNFMKGNKFETIEDLQNALNGKFIEVFDEKNKIWQEMVKNLTKTEQELDTWQRACELASETLKQVMGKPLWIGGNIPTPEVKDSDYFYQQAKKEGEQK